jgi:hypothetical protein
MRGSGGIAPLFLTSALDGGDWPALLPMEIASSRYPLDKRLDGPTASLDSAENQPPFLYRLLQSMRIHLNIILKFSPCVTANCDSTIKEHFNIVHPPTSRSSQWSLSFCFSHQYPICIVYLYIHSHIRLHGVVLN